MSRKFLPGDTVCIRSWDDMLAEFGGNEVRIHCRLIFTSRMKYLCGKEFVIERIDSDGRVRLLPALDVWSISTDMLELAAARPVEMPRSFADILFE